MTATPEPRSENNDTRSPTGDHTALVARGTATTSRADRYLDQLCRHLEKATQGDGLWRGRHQSRSHAPDHAGNAQPSPQITRTPTGAVIHLGPARALLGTTDTQLTITAEAPTPADLAQLQERLAATIARIGRRERLAVTWTQSMN